MKTTINCSQEEITRAEIRRFVSEGLQDVYEDKLLDFDSAFEEIEERYSTNE